jgi:DNA-binding beta-propeller fold protein YncE
MKRTLIVLLLLVSPAVAQKKEISLPTSKVLLAPAPGSPQRLDSLPTTAVLSPDHRYLVILNGGFGTIEGKYRQGISVLDLETSKVGFFPDDRLGKSARQTYFLGLAFSADGTELYASVGSLTDPLAKRPGSTGNGIAVYRFESGQVSAGRFVPIPPQPLAAGKRRAKGMNAAPPNTLAPFPAGLAVVPGHGNQLLVADNLSDDVLLLDIGNGKILRRFDLSTSDWIPASYPYAVEVSRDGRRAWCSLWNASRVAELDLTTGMVSRSVSLHPPQKTTDPGSHPNAMLLSPDEKYLYVALANTDEIAVVPTAGGAEPFFLSTRLEGQRLFGGTPNALAQTRDGKRLFVANADSDTVAVLSPTAAKPLGFIPTDRYPTALAVSGKDLLIVSGKAQGTGPNSAFTNEPGREHPYIAALLHGSVARVRIPDAEKKLAALTREAEQSNLMNGRSATLPFLSGRNPIKHVLYIIKENRTYDQVFGDLPVGDNDKSLVMYGAGVTPNHHKLALQFGVYDNFYDSGEVSGDGHVWSNAAITSDFTEKIWQIAYRGKEREYDFEGRVLSETPLEQGIGDINEPGSGYLWANAARHNLTYRNYGEFVPTTWCKDLGLSSGPGASGPTSTETTVNTCPRKVINPGEPLPEMFGGGPSPWPWPVPLPAFNSPTKPELRGHFNPDFPWFNLDYPDQFRADIFLKEFAGWVRERQSGRDPMPNFITMSLSDDHTGGTRPGFARPAASVADNDLALGRIVDTISHSPYWDDTAIFVLEDDAQNGADHVDAHRSLALVISKYAPSSLLDHHFYTTVNMVATMEAVLNLPPMNNNDAQAALMAPAFSGEGTQSPFTADYSNRETRFIYAVNPPKAQGGKTSMKMNFSRPDAVDTSVLNRILWRDAKGNTPMPRPRHTVIPERTRPGDDD